jgi:hypothetical protein
LFIPPLLMFASVFLGVRGLRNFGLVGTRATALGALVVADVLGIPLLFNLPFELSTTFGAVVIPSMLLAFIACRRVGISWLAAAAIAGAGLVCSQTNFAVGWALLLAIYVVATGFAARALIQARRAAQAAAQDDLKTLLQALAASRHGK